MKYAIWFFGCREPKIKMVFFHPQWRVAVLNSALSTKVWSPRHLAAGCVNDGIHRIHINTIKPTQTNFLMVHCTRRPITVGILTGNLEDLGVIPLMSTNAGSIVAVCHGAVSISLVLISPHLGPRLYRGLKLFIFLPTLNHCALSIHLLVWLNMYGNVCKYWRELGRSEVFWKWS